MRMVPFFTFVLALVVHGCSKDKINLNNSELIGTGECWVAGRGTTMTSHPIDREKKYDLEACESWCERTEHCTHYTHNNVRKYKGYQKNKRYRTCRLYIG